MLDPSTFIQAAVTKNVLECVPRTLLLYNAVCKHSSPFCVAVKLDSFKERECHDHDVRKLEIAAIIVEDLAHNGRWRVRGDNRGRRKGKVRKFNFFVLCVNLTKPPSQLLPKL